MPRLRPRRPHVTDVRTGIDRARWALEKTDAALAYADGAIVRADHATAKARRWAPRVAVVVGVMAALTITAGVVGTVVIVRQRRARNAQQALDESANI